MKTTTKCLLIAFLSIIMIVSMSISIFADELVEENNDEMDNAATMVMRNQLSESETTVLTNSENYDWSMRDKSIANQPILRIYSDVFWEIFDNPLEMVLSEAETATNKLFNGTEYIVLDTVPYRIRMRKDKKETPIGLVKAYSSYVPVYIADILKLSGVVSIKEDTCKLEGVYCFNGEESHQGIVVYLKTDKGVYVKYYENSTSQAQLFTEEEFRKNSSAYNDYITSYEHNYNENGEALYGEVNFISFIQNNQPTDDISNQNNGTPTFALYLIIGAIVALLAVGGGCLIVKKKGKMSKSSTETKSQSL